MSLMKMNWITVVGLMTMGGVAHAQKSTVTTNAVTQKKSSSDGAAGPVLRRSNRMEFDGRLIKGERAAGAVYLFNRVPRKLPPLLKLERDELDRIVWPVLKRPADKPKASKIAADKGLRKAAETKIKQGETKAKKLPQRSWKRSKKKKWKAKRR